MGQIWSFWDLVPYVLGIGISTGIDITLYFTYLGVCPNLRAGIKIPKSSTQTFFQEITIHLISTFYHLQWKTYRRMALAIFWSPKSNASEGGTIPKPSVNLAKLFRVIYVLSYMYKTPTEYNLKLQWCH